MTEDLNKGNAAAGKPGEPGKAQKFHFEVDGRQFETSEAQLTGLQIKALAGIDPTYLLTLEGRGQRPDRSIGDGDIVALNTPGKETFYTTPPATYGRGGQRVAVGGAR